MDLVLSSLLDVLLLYIKECLVFRGARYLVFVVSPLARDA
jgi:hypothetical protein